MTERATPRRRAATGGASTDGAASRPVREVRTLWIPMPDGRRLAARMWLPGEAAPVPAIVEAIPYRRLDGTVSLDARSHPWWAARGYAAIRIDIAGSGDSDGLLQDEYLPGEQDDICEALAWIARQPWCNGITGMIGISWGGFAALQAAARRAPSLKAIIACCASDDRYGDDVHYMGGCLLNDHVSWGAGIFSCISRWPDPLTVGEGWRAMWARRLEETGCPLIGWTRRQRRDAFWRAGSVAEGAIEAAVFCVGGWTDGYSNALLRLMATLRGPKRALIGPWTHVYPHFGTPGAPMGFLQEALRWWDRWLKGSANGIDDEATLTLWQQEGLRPHPMHLALEGRWIGEHGWPPTAARLRAAQGAAPAGPEGGVLTLALGDGILGEPSERHSPAGGGQRHLWKAPLPAAEAAVLRHASPLACGLAGGEWCPRDGGGSGPEYQGDQRGDDMLSLTFDTPPLAAAVTVLGAPEVELVLAIDRAQGMIAVRLNEVASDGRSARVAFALLNLSHRHSSERPQPMVPGRAERVRLRLGDTAYRFRPGCRLRLAISTSYWPMAWPAPEPVTMALETAASRLLLPLRRGEGADRALPVFAPPVFAPPHPVRALRAGSVRRTLERDVGSRAIVLRHLEDSGTDLIEDIGLETSKRSEETFSIVEGDPASARTDMLRLAKARRGRWRVATATRIGFSCDAESFRITASLEAFEGGRRIAERRWDETVPRDHM